MQDMSFYMRSSRLIPMSIWISINQPRKLHSSSICLEVRKLILKCNALSVRYWHERHTPLGVLISPRQSAYRLLNNGITEKSIDYYTCYVI